MDHSHIQSKLRWLIHLEISRGLLQHALPLWDKNSCHSGKGFRSLFVGHDDGDDDDDDDKEDFFSIVQNPLVQPLLERAKVKRDISLSASPGEYYMLSIVARQAERDVIPRVTATALTVTQPELHWRQRPLSLTQSTESSDLQLEEQTRLAL